MKRLTTLVAALALFAVPAFAAAQVNKSPPDAPYEQVSKLVKIPDFLPGLGQLFVDPKTLPAGPFLAYDHKGKLVSTIYMVPIDEVSSGKSFNDLKSPGGTVDHVTVAYNVGHPGVEKPHLHIILWHVGKAGEQLVAK